VLEPAELIAMVVSDLQAVGRIYRRGKPAKCMKKPGLRFRKPAQKVEAAGIAPASRIPQVVRPHTTCVEHGCQWLHYVCTDAALQELVANWHRLTPSVREKVMALVLTSQAVP